MDAKALKKHLLGRMAHCVPSMTATTDPVGIAVPLPEPVSEPVQRELRELLFAERHFRLEIAEVAGKMYGVFFPLGYH